MEIIPRNITLAQKKIDIQNQNLYHVQLVLTILFPSVHCNDVKARHSTTDSFIPTLTTILKSITTTTINNIIVTTKP